MIREVKFESQDRRIKQIIAALNENGIKDIEEANAICVDGRTIPIDIMSKESTPKGYEIVLDVYKRQGRHLPEQYRFCRLSTRSELRDYMVNSIYSEIKGLS